MASWKETIHAHTYSGRYEQYRAKHDYLLDQSLGEARYVLEQRLDADAKKHAQRTVAIEILGVAVVATGAVVLGRSLKNGDLIGDVRNLENAIREIPTKVSFAYRKFVRTTGELFMGGMLSRAQEDGPDVLDSLTPAAARMSATAANSASEVLLIKLGKEPNAKAASFRALVEYIFGKK